MSSSSVLERFRPLFYPESIAVVGASDNPSKLGFQSLAAARSGFRGAVYPVNPGAAGEIQGLSAYRSLADVPGRLDLVVYAVPEPLVAPAVREAAARGARAGVIFAGGFREVGGKGAGRQRELVEIANAAGMQLIGPNCIGVVNTKVKLNATFAAPMSWFPAGSLSVVSQSGGVGSAVATQMADEAVGLSKFVSIGNRANVDFADMLAYLAEDDDTGVVALFVEGIDEGRGFLKAAAACAARKPVVVCSRGHTEKASRTALSHTGSAASSERVYAGALRQAGCVRVGSLEDLVCTAKAMTMAAHLGGNGCFISTHTAGPAIIIAEILERGGVRLPELEPALAAEIAAFIPEHARAGNPLDLFAHAWTDGSLYVRATDIALRQPNIHCAVAVYISSMGAGPAFPLAEYAEVARRHGKPVFLCLIAPGMAMQELAAAQQAGVVTFNTPEKAGHALVGLTRWVQGRRPAGVGA
ncbi:MAG: CoA-binding protein [Candidatus Geothermincolia bacterium]